MDFLASAGRRSIAASWLRNCIFGNWGPKGEGVFQNVINAIMKECHNNGNYSNCITARRTNAYAVNWARNAHFANIIKTSSANGGVFFNVDIIIVLVRHDSFAGDNVKRLFHIAGAVDFISQFPGDHLGAGGNSLRNFRCNAVRFLGACIDNQSVLASDANFAECESTWEILVVGATSVYM